MRVLFCGSGAFAAPSLRAILSSDHDLAGVVTQPPRPAGRGGKLRATLAAEIAREAGQDVIECANINDEQVVERLGAMKLDVICVAEFGQMIRLPARETAAVDTFNVHGSLLPDLRGAAPVNWAIIRGYERTGVTTFSLVDRMDAGAMYVKKETDIAPDETARELKARLADLGAAAAMETLAMLADGTARPQDQDDSQATLAPLLEKADGVIDWSADATTIRNRIRGTWPWPGGQAVLKRRDGRDVPVVIASVSVEPAPAGEGGRLDESLRVETADGALHITEIKPAGKRLMAWRDFVNGSHLQAGDRFKRPGG